MTVHLDTATPGAGDTRDAVVTDEAIVVLLHDAGPVAAVSRPASPALSCAAASAPRQQAASSQPSAGTSR